MTQVLLIEDDDALRVSLAQTIELAGMTALSMASYVQARRSIRANFAGVILSDIRMPHQDGFDVLRAAQTADPDLPVILLTGHSDVPTAMRAMKEGAWDYLEKPCAPDRLLEVLGRALSHRKLVLKSRRIERALLRNDPAAVNFPGRGKATETLRQALRTVAAMRAPVHLTGPDGTGKRQAAWVINQLAPDHCPLIRIDLARDVHNYEIPDGPVDIACRNAELARTDAIETVSQNSEARLITLSTRPLAEIRIAESLPDTVEIAVPTLDERREDLAEIFETLLRQTARSLNTDMPEVPQTLIAEIMTRPWPGQLPQLRAFATSFALGTQVHDTAQTGTPLAEQVEAFEKLVITETLRRKNGSAAEAAKSLGLPRNTFYDRLTRYGLSARDFRNEQ